MQFTAQMQFGRSDSPTEVHVTTYADGMINVTVQNTEVPGHACDTELPLSQAIHLRDFLNRHIDSLALDHTGSTAERASDNPAQLSCIEELRAVTPVRELRTDVLPDSVMNRVKPGNTFRHQNGLDYVVMTVARDEDAGVYMVVHQGIHDGRVWVRTVSNFLGMKNGEPRFLHTGGLMSPAGAE